MEQQVDLADGAQGKRDEIHILLLGLQIQPQDIEQLMRRLSMQQLVKRGSLVLIVAVGIVVGRYEQGKVKNELVFEVVA